MSVKKKGKSLALDDVMCPVCLDVLIEPVTMSCKHELCKECYMLHFNTCDFLCPICKKRLSTWARQAISNGTLVNEKKWLIVQKEYPDLIQNRQNGKPNHVFLQTIRNSNGLVLSQPGEVEAEYIAMREQWLRENSSQKQQEEEASMKLIKQIQEEEKQELERAKRLQQESDERLARQISKELNLKVSPKSVNKIILRPRTPRCSGELRRPLAPKQENQVAGKRKRTSSSES